MTRPVSRMWTLVWAWAALLFVGLPKIAQVAEAQAGAPGLLALQGSTKGLVYCRPCECPDGMIGGIPYTEGSFGEWTCWTMSDYPVHYLTGEPFVSSVDLTSGGFGGSALTRDWSTTYHSNPGGNLGPGWAVMQWPRITRTGPAYFTATGGREHAAFYDAGSGNFTSQHFFNEKLSSNAGAQELILTDTLGNRTIYHDFTVTAALQGQFKQFKDAAGNVTTVTRGSSGVTLNQITETQRSFTSGSDTTTESWLYDYVLAGADTGKLLTVTLRRKLNAGAFATVRKVDFSYYSGSSNGPNGYLQRAVIKDAASAVLLTKYYRYYTAGNWVGGLKYVVEGAAYERLKAAQVPATDAQVDLAPDTGAANAVENFAGNYFEYDASKRVTKEIVQGAGCSCAGNNSRGRFTFAYSINPFFFNSYDVWKQKTTMQFLDRNDALVWTKTVYTNYTGEVMLEVFKDESQPSLLWRTFYKYDSAGRLIWKALPSAVTGHDETKNDLLNLVSNNYQHMSDSSGLVYVFDYGSSTTATTTTTGDVLGYRKGYYCKQGELGTLVKQSLTEYIKYTGDAGDTFPVSRRTVYRDTGGLQPIATNWTYTWQGTTHQVNMVTATYPAAQVSQNGPGSSDTEDFIYDSYGRLVWHRIGVNEDAAWGVGDYTEYDPATGAVVKRIIDTDTFMTSDYTIQPPMGWYLIMRDHRKTSFLVDGMGRPTKITDPKAQITYIVYKDASWETRFYPGWDAGTLRPTGPTEVVRRDKLGSYVERLTSSATPTTSSGVPTGAESIVTATLQTLSREYIDPGERVSHSDRYYNFTGLTYGSGVNIGTLNTHYNRTTFGYDDLGNINRTQDGLGTIYRTVYDRLNRPVSSWIGTNDTPPTGFWSPTNNGAPSNMQKTWECRYDDPNNTGVGGVGDGTLTQSIEFASDATTYTTQHRYDFRDRPEKERGPDNRAFQRTFDNLNRATVSELYADGNADFVIGSTERRAKYERSFDEKGQLYQEGHYEVSTSGVVSDRLTTNHWYDYRGNRIKTRNANGLIEKWRYDGSGRLRHAFVTMNAAETNYADVKYLFNDTVLTQSVRIYDKVSNLAAYLTYERNDDFASTGELSWSDTNYRQVSVFWYDKADRLINAVNYGRDNGLTRYVINTGGSLIDADFSMVPDIAEGAPPAVNTSDDYIVTKYEYDAAGFLNKTTDNLSHLTQKTFDREGKALTRIENYANGAVGNSEYASDRTTLWAYTNGLRVSTVTARNAKGGLVENQVTTYQYTSAISASWVTGIVYPDGTAGTDQETFTHDRLGRRVTLTDQRTLVHTYAYDSAGRFLSDAITSLPSGVDGAVQRIQLGYDDLSRPQFITSWDAPSAGNRVSEVQLTYDGWAEVQKSEQSHVGAVVPGTTPAVQYTFQDGASGGVAKYVRLASVAYPGASRTAYFNYPSAGSAGDLLDRVDNIAEDALATTKYTQYTYMGTYTAVKIANPGVTSGLNLDYGAASSGAYSGFDRFGRIANQKWQNNAGTTIHDGYSYSYDRVGNRTSRNLLMTLQPATPKDEFYVYDGLDRLFEFRRGALTGSPLAITQAASNYYQQWANLEPVGNWKSWKIDTNGGGGGQLSTQSRLHNLANEIDNNNIDSDPAGASISGTGVNWVDPTYDKAGNLKSAPKVGDESTAASRQWYTYDGWNRLVKVQGDTGGAAGTTIVEYQYDGLHRRIVKLKSNGANWDRTDFYYNESWQCLEERFLANTASKTTVATAVKAQYVWDLRYVDALAVRWRDADGNGSLEEKLYYCQDANANVTALVDSAGNVVERYNYEPYGNTSIYDASWGPRTSSSYANEILFAGYRRDPESLIYYVRNRYLHQTLGRWLQRDPIGYADGWNLYQYGGSSPLAYVDPWGLLSLAQDPQDLEILKKFLKGQGADGKSTLEKAIEDAYDKMDPIEKLGSPLAPIKRPPKDFVKPKDKEDVEKKKPSDEDKQKELDKRGKARRMGEILIPPGTGEPTQPPPPDWRKCADPDKLAKAEEDAAEEVKEIDKETQERTRQKQLAPPGTPGSSGSLGRQPALEKAERAKDEELRRKRERAILEAYLRLVGLSEQCEGKRTGGDQKFEDEMKKVLPKK